MAFPDIFNKTFVLFIVYFIIVCALPLTKATDHVHDDYESENYGFQSNNIFFDTVNAIKHKETFRRSNATSTMKNILNGIYDMYYSTLLPILLNQDTNEYNTEHWFEGEHRQEKGKTLSDGIPGDYDFKALHDSLNMNDNPGVSPACLNDLAALVFGLATRQKWATPFLDAMGKPGPSITLYRLHWVGNYKQCLASGAPPNPELSTEGFKGKYCDVGLSIAPSIGINIGACVPDSCEPSDLLNLTKTLFNITDTSKISAMKPDCHTEEREVTSATIAAIVLISIIAFFMIVGTLFDLIAVQLPKWNQYDDVTPKEPLMDNTRLNIPRLDKPYEHPEIISEASPLVTKEDREPSKHLEHGVLAKVLLAFSVYSNAKKILNTSQPPGSLGAIHGIRFISMSWVVLCHLLAYIEQFSDNAFEILPELLRRWTFSAIGNGFPSVDTFFTLSGLLTSYLTIKEMKRKSWKINWPLFYFHRFWRLTPPYMLTLVSVLGLMRFFGSGPLWPDVLPADKANCEKNWWTNLLYINNLQDFPHMCFGHSWYLANDMQFFVLSPLMLIPFYFHAVAGFASCLFFLTINMVTTGVLSHEKGWPATTVSLSPEIAVTGATWMSDYYITPWCRIGPFVIGILAGYILAVTNGAKNIRLRPFTVILGWVVTIGTGLAVVYGLAGNISGEHVSSVGAAALYNATSRSAWGVCICLVIILCASGYGGPINAFLSWSPFVFLGKLTYMSYLAHICIVQTYFDNRDALFHMNDTNLAVTYIGLLVTVNMISFVLVLAFESPMIGLERAFLRKDRRS